ncbi:MAG TPA: TonB-dependent receptor [Vicinamibacteria bacterium]|nr:TonB-dependent receptor [Vicinamibacteria bacterium]
MKRLAVFAALLAFAFAAAPASAQSLVGSVEGTVTDEQGGALPGVTVTLTGKTGSKTATTGPDGTYRFAALEPGDYTVTANIAGFATVRRDQVRVSVAKASPVNFTMKVGGVTETIDVVGETPVDVTSSATDNSLDQDFLFNLPISRTNAAVGTLNYLPGVNDGAAFGGDSDAGNALMLDGVDTRDPEGGTAWTFFNYNIMEEVQVGGLGAPAEYGAFTGGFVNTITKSGGNRFSGLFDINYTNDSDLFAYSNADDETIALNPSLAEPAVTTKLLDVTAQLSGPLVHDKLFFFASAQRYERITDPSGPTTIRDEVSPRINTKLTWQPDASNTITGTMQYDSYNIIGRIPGAYPFTSTDATTNREDAPEWVWMGNWRHLFGSNTFSEVKFAGWTGFFDLNPEVNLPGRFNEFGLPYVSQGWFAYYDRGRNQVNASLSHFAEKWGKHDLKFGVEIERSRVRNRYGYVNDINYYDYSGAPYVAYDYGYDLGGKNSRESVFVQDSWQVNDRLTLNLGGRADFMRGSHDPHDGQQDVGEVWNTKGIAPRLGFALDVTGDNRTVLKGTYSQYYEGAFFSMWSTAVPGVEDFVIYDVTACPSINTACPRSNFVEIGRFPATLYRIDEDIEHPRRDEITVGLERAIGRDYRFAVTGIWRDAKNLVSSVIPSARWAPITVTSANTDALPSRTVPAYRWLNPSQSDEDFLITNPDGFQFLDANGNVLGEAEAKQNYKAVMAVLTKRFSNRWQGQLSYVWSDNSGTVNNNGATTFGAGRLFQTPTLALVNNEGPLGFSREHEIKAYATYQIPVIEVGVNGLLRTFSGRPYAAFQRFSSSAINFGVSSAGRQPFLEPRGSRTMPWLTLLDVRFDKYFKLGGGKDQLSLYVDIQNILNQGKATNFQTRVPAINVLGPFTGPTCEPLGDNQICEVAFNSPTAIQTPRQVLLGARFSF